MANNFLTVQGPRFKLAGAGITSSATTIILSSFQTSTSTNIVTADIGALGYLVLEPGTSRMENISFTTITQNADGTATLTGVTRGLGFTSPYTTVSANQFAHAGGSIAILSNPSPFYYKFTAKDNDETVAGTWIFTAVPSASADPVSGNDLARRSWVLSQVNGGAVSTDNLIVAATAGETVAAGNLLYFDLTDNEWKKTDADTAATVDGVMLGIAQGAGTDGVAITGGILLFGIDTNQSGMTQGDPQYASNTAGGISSSAGTTERAIGIARSTTNLFFNPYFTDLLTAKEKDAVVGVSGTAVSSTNKLLDEQSLTGVISPYCGRSAPTGWLLCDGTAVSRATYSRLFAVVAPSATFTVTIASPGVFTSTAHGLVIGDVLHFTTTGALPTGLATNTNYYVISAGLTSDAFEVALVPGGAAVNTSGSQSGTHTLYKSAWGKGDGSTTFNLPDLRSRSPVGKGQATTVLTFESGQVNTGDDTVTILDTVFPSQGQAVVLSTAGTLPTGLSATTYYIIRASATTIKFATSLANANTATAVDITGAGSGVHTMTFTGRDHTVIGRMGGEETHGLSRTEMPAHTHTFVYKTSSAGGENLTRDTSSATAGDQTVTPNSAGGDEAHNIMSPFAVVQYIIKT